MHFSSAQINADMPQCNCSWHAAIFAIFNIVGEGENLELFGCLLYPSVNMVFGVCFTVLRMPDVNCK